MYAYWWLLDTWRVNEKKMREASCFSWRSGFYYYPQVFIFRRWNSSVKTQGQNSYSIDPCLLVVKKTPKNLIRTILRMRLQDQMSNPRQDDWLIVYCFMSCSEFFHSIEASATLTGNGCNVFVHWENLYRVAPGEGSEITWPVLRFLGGSNEKPEGPVSC